MRRVAIASGSGGHGVAQRGHQAAPERGPFAAARATLDVRVEANAVRRIQPPVDGVDEARLDVGAAQLGHEAPPALAASASQSGRCFSRRSMWRRASWTRTFTAARRRAEDRRDLFHRIALEHVQHERGPALRAQLGQQRLDQRQRSRAAVTRSGPGVGEPARPLVQRRRHRAGCRRRAAAHAYPDGDAGQPGREQGVAPKVGQRSERLDERRLHQIVDVRARAHHPPHDPVNGAHVGLEQVAKGLGIALPRAVDQGRHLGRGRTRGSAMGSTPSIVGDGAALRLAGKSWQSDPGPDGPG